MADILDHLAFARPAERLHRTSSCAVRERQRIGRQNFVCGDDPRRPFATTIDALDIDAYRHRRRATASVTSVHFRRGRRRASTLVFSLVRFARPISHHGPSNWACPARPLITPAQTLRLSPSGHILPVETGRMDSHRPQSEQIPSPRTYEERARVRGNCVTSSAETAWRSRRRSRSSLRSLHARDGLDHVERNRRSSIISTCGRPATSGWMVIGKTA